MADSVVLDFTNVKEGGGSFTKKRVKAGDYAMRVTKFEWAEIKKGDNKGDKQMLFTLAIEGRHGATYPYYCQLSDNTLWKLRNLLVAAGINVPKKKVKVDPNRLVNKLVGATLDDTEYDGRDQSEITAVFPASELDSDAVDDPDDDDDDDDEEEETPVRKPKKKAAPEPDDDDEDEDDSDSEDDDDDDDDEPEPAPKKKKKKKPAPADDDDEDDLSDLDVDDL